MSSIQSAPTTINLADATVHRLGFGTMQLTGPGVWGPPPDRRQAIAVLRRVVELGVQFIDTADSYGPWIAEDLIRETLYPYPDDVVAATKAGFVRTGPDQPATGCRGAVDSGTVTFCNGQRTSELLSLLICGQRPAPKAAATYAATAQAAG